MKLIPLSKGRFTKVDDQDYDWLMQWKWTFDTGYAVRFIYQKGQKRVKIRMQCVIIPPAPGMEIDHINTDRLDNQRENLRSCTHAQNSRNNPLRKDNKSGYKGVVWNRGKWQVYIKAFQKLIYLGRFNLIEDAARAYDQAARKYFGEYARTNFQDR